MGIYKEKKMKITTAKLKQIIKEELMREMGDVAHLFPYKVMTNASGAPAQFKDLDAAIATAKAWEEAGILVPEGTSGEVLDVIYRGEKLDPTAQRYEDEERDIKRAGPSPQMAPEEHEDYMALYDKDEEYEELQDQAAAAGTRDAEDHKLRRQYEDPEFQEDYDLGYDDAQEFASDL